MSLPPPTPVALHTEKSNRQPIAAIIATVAGTAKNPDLFFFIRTSYKKSTGLYPVFLSNGKLKASLTPPKKNQPACTPFSYQTENQKRH
jgi:hypothetical protein